MSESIPERIATLKTAIAAQEGLRSTLGDEVVDATIAVLEKQIAELETQIKPVEQQRKQITVLFADIKGFTAMSETMDAEDVNEVMNALWQRLDGAITKQGGKIDKHMGDAVMALWGADIAHEDDPERAIHAALAMQSDIAEFKSAIPDILEAQATGVGGGEPVEPSVIRMRIGIHTGPVLLGEVGTTGEFTAIGDTVNTASRLEHAAPVGGILISYETYRHVRGIFELQAQEPISVRGKQELIQVYIVQRARPRSFRTTTRGVEGVETRMIGREAQLERLQDILNTAKDAQCCQVVNIVGEAGVGKSRLVHEFNRWIDTLAEIFCIFKGRAGEEMRNLPHSLMRDVFAHHFQIQESDPSQVVWKKIEVGIGEGLGLDEDSRIRAHFIGQLIGFDFRLSPYLEGVLDDAQQLRDRALTYIGEYFEAMSAEHPMVLFLEDIHWADDSSMDMIDSLIQSLSHQRLLIVCAARPTLFEHRSDWGSDPRIIQLTIQPLSRPDSRLLVDEILQKVDDVPDVLREIVVGNAEGNPFYMEELIKMLVEDGVIVKGQDRWRIEPFRLAQVRVPPTLTGILQARFDSLPSEERITLQRASVIGRIFWADAVMFLRTETQTPLGLTTQALDDLQNREMIFLREPSTFVNTLEYTFKHALLREATYESVLKRDRRTYHAQAADWLISHSGERADEVAGMIADHLERAGQTEQAVIYLKRAGEQAVAHFANTEAVNYFTRALNLTPEANSASMYAILMHREWVLHIQGERVAQAEDLAVLADLAEALDDDHRRTDVALRQAAFQEMTSDFPAALAAARQAVQWAEGSGLYIQEVQGLIAWSRVLLRQGDFENSRDRLEKALHLAREQNDRAGEAASLHYLGTVCYYQADYRSASRHLEQALEIRRALGDQRGEATSLNNLAGVYHALEDFSQGKNITEQVLAIYQAIGDRHHEAASLGNLGNIHHALGELTSARDLYQQALKLYRAIGDRRGEALVSQNMGLVLYDLEEYPEARRYSDRALAIARDIGDRSGEGDSLSSLALALEGLNELEAAAAAYQQAMALRLEIGQPALAIDDQAGFTRITLKQGDIDLSISTTEEILTWIDQNDIGGIEYPLRVYLTCADVLLAAGKRAAATEILKTAHELLQERAAHISDENARKTFLEKVPLHRQLSERLAALV